MNALLYSFLVFFFFSFPSPRTTITTETPIQDIIIPVNEVLIHFKENKSKQTKTKSVFFPNNTTWVKRERGEEGRGEELRILSFSKLERIPFLLQSFPPPFFPSPFLSPPPLFSPPPLSPNKQKTKTKKQTFIFGCYNRKERRQ